jgi:hypothetical protein
MSQNHNYPIDYNKDKSGSIPAAPPNSKGQPFSVGFFGCLLIERL